VHGLPPELSPTTRQSHPRRSDGVARRANSCSPLSKYMRSRRVRRRWWELEHVGASGQVVSWTRHGVRVKVKNGLSPKPLNHGFFMNDTTQPQLDFLATEIPRFEACGA
jgi:hypothetical protein